jgi:hypothetical protein
MPLLQCWCVQKVVRWIVCWHPRPVRQVLALHCRHERCSACVLPTEPEGRPAVRLWAHGAGVLARYVHRRHAQDGRCVFAKGLGAENGRLPISLLQGCALTSSGCDFEGGLRDWRREQDDSCKGRSPRETHVVLVEAVADSNPPVKPYKRLVKG